MVNVLAHNLSEKGVIADGRNLGVLENVTMDIKTGSISHLLVEPRDGAQLGDLDFDWNEEGRLRVPVDRVQAVEDHILVEC